MRDESDPTPGLRLHHAHQIGVGHRRQRVVAHTAVAEQLIAHEQMAFEHGAQVFRERRADDRETLARAVQRIEQRVSHRADVAFCGRIEGRAVFEIDLLHALLLQPAQRGQRLRHRVGRRNRSRLQRDDDRIDLAVERAVRDADRLHRAHAGAHKVIGQIGGAGEVVGNAA